MAQKKTAAVFDNRPPGRQAIRVNTAPMSRPALKMIGITTILTYPPALFFLYPTVANATTQVRLHHRLLNHKSTPGKHRPVVISTFHAPTILIPIIIMHIVLVDITEVLRIYSIMA